MLNPFAILFSSKENFERIRIRSDLGNPYFIVVAGTSLLTWLKSCWRGTSFVADFAVLASAFISMSISLFVRVVDIGADVIFFVNRYSSAK